MIADAQLRLKSATTSSGVMDLNGLRRAFPTQYTKCFTDFTSRDASWSETVSGEVKSTTWVEEGGDGRDEARADSFSEL